MAQLNPNDYEFADESPAIDLKKLNPETSNIQSGLKQAGLGAAGLASSAIGGLGQIASIPAHLMGGIDYLTGKQRSEKELANSQAAKELPRNIRKSVAKNLFGLSEEDIEPDNPLSQAAQSTASNLPILAATGGVGLGRVGADFVGSLFQSGAQSLGWGPIGQIAASALGQKGFGAVAGLFKKSLKNPSFVNNFKQDLYNKEPVLGSKFKLPTEELKSSLEKTKEKLALQFPHEYRFPESASGRAFKVLDIAEKKLNGPSITGSDLYKIQKELNDVYLKPTTTEGRYFNDVLGAVKNQLNKAAEKHPEWGKIWKEADQLHTLQNWQSGLSDALDNLTTGGRLEKILKNKVGKYVLAGLSTGSNIIDLGIEQASRPGLLLNHLRKTKDGQKVLWDIIANSAKRDTNALAKSLYKFDKIADEFDFENPESKLNPNDYEFSD